MAMPVFLKRVVWSKGRQHCLLILPPRKATCPLPSKANGQIGKEALPFFLGFMAVLGAAFFLLSSALASGKVELFQWKFS
ncbi:hypothetical protein VXQ18_07550, partial [Brucella abortus]|nr:hypothetical protein [Brucella abortus]